MCSSLRECVRGYVCVRVRVCVCECVCVGRKSLLECFDAKIVYEKKNVLHPPTSLFDMGRRPSSINFRSFVRSFVRSPPSPPPPTFPVPNKPSRFCGRKATGLLVYLVFYFIFNTEILFNKAIAPFEGV